MVVYHIRPVSDWNAATIKSLYPIAYADAFGAALARKLIAPLGFPLLKLLLLFLAESRVYIVD
jgi:hypothetical protein